MSAEHRPDKPAKVSAIGVMLLVSGIINVAASVLIFGFGVLQGLVTLGIGFSLCLPGLFLLPMGVVELQTGLRHLSADPRPMRRPVGLALAQCAGILGCNPLCVAVGAVILSLLSDPEVVAWYETRYEPEGQEAAR